MIENRKMDDVKLIQLVRIYPALYNSSHSKYMDSSYKSEVWNIIGKEMELEGKFFFKHIIL